MSKDGKVIPTQVKIGTKVIFNAGWDNEVGEKEENLFLVEESAVLATIK
jgi:co-chaperonin GroES (HSP10)